MTIPMDTMPPSVARYLSYKLSIQGSSEKTVYEYGIVLNNFFSYLFRARFSDENKEDLSQISDKDIASVTSQQIYEYLLHCATVLHNQNATRARKLSAIKGFYKFLAHKEKSIPEDPTQHIDAPRVSHPLPRFLSLAESEKLLDAVRLDQSNPNRLRDNAILTLFLNTGMRVSEMASISLSDFSSDCSELIVTGKGNKQRLIYLNSVCVSALSAYVAQRKGIVCRDNEALFVSRNHRRLSVKTIQWLVYKYLKLAGLGDMNYSVHKLRHTAATLMYGTGKVDVRVLKDILGHEQLNTTQIYTHVSDQQMKNAMESNPLNEKK